MRNKIFFLLLTLGLLGGLHSLRAQEIRIMSYNIRLDLPSDGVNWWENRKSRVAGLMNYYEADFIGCQEVLYKQLSYLDSNLKGYSYIGVGRDDGKQAGEYSCIFYKKDRYELLKQSTFWLSPTPDLPSKGWDAALNRVCTYGYFRHKNSGQELWVFNTHFDHMGKQARLESAKLILKKIKELNETHAPVLLSGDFNSRPEDPPSQEILTQLWNAREKSQLVYGEADTWNAFKFNEKPNGCIDYIFAAPFPYLTVKKFATLSDSYDLKYPSDHLPILATVQISQPFIREIANFRKQDSLDPPATGKVLFIGSSSFTNWKDVQSYFPKSTIINRAFGGSALIDLDFYFDDILPQYKPRQIVMYCGENDLANTDTVSAAMLLDRFRTVFNRIRSIYPAVPLVYISIKPSPSRWHLREKAKEANAAIRSFLSTQKNTTFINVWDLMLTSEGKPDESIFGPDMLHMNTKGYAIWKKLLEPVLIRDSN